MATDGYKFGHDALIWYWESKDLVSWTQQRALPVMAAFEGEFQDTWAPEWVWDAAAKEYVVFWTTRWLPGKADGKFDPSCTNPNPQRFSQWHSRTKDWRTFTRPSVLIDMHCNNDSFAPMALGDGGYDCDIVQAPDGMYHAYFKSMQAVSNQAPSACHSCSLARSDSAAGLSPRRQSKASRGRTRLCSRGAVRHPSHQPPLSLG